jgi:hypothetical protein
LPNLLCAQPTMQPLMPTSKRAVADHNKPSAPLHDMGRPRLGCDLLWSKLSHTGHASGADAFATTVVSRCFCCFCRKLSASETAFLAEILGCRGFSRGGNTGELRAHSLFPAVLARKRRYRNPPFASDACRPRDL